MHTNASLRAVRWIALAGAIAAPLAIAQASPATAPPATDERAACAQLADPASRRACRRDIAAARAEARREGATPAAGAPDYERNALQRCEALPLQDRPACEKRVRGEGYTSGSVEGGGIYRETREIVPAAPASR